jgi:RNA polymerase-binding transcription factor
MVSVRNSTWRKSPMKTTRTRKLPAPSNGRSTTARRNGSSAGPNGKAKANLPAERTLTLKERLDQERREVELELERMRAELKETPDATGDEVDLAVYDREKTLALIATYERRLEEIDYALRAAQKGAYGICERCGKPIDPERLKIFPEATLCVSCKNEKEKLAKRGIF